MMRKHPARERLTKLPPAPAGRLGRVSRSGAIPGPTVIVRMIENGKPLATRRLPPVVLPFPLDIPHPLLLSSATGALSIMQQAIDIKSKSARRVAFIQSSWHKDIVDQCRVAFVEEMGKRGYSEDAIDFFEVAGAFE